MSNPANIRQIKPDDDLSKHIDVRRHIHTRAGYTIRLAVKPSVMSDESELVLRTNTANIHLALEEAYDEAGVQGFPIIAGVMSVVQLSEQEV